MKKLLNVLPILLILVIASWFVSQNLVYSQKPPVEQTIKFKQHFDWLRVSGSIIIYDLDRDIYYQHNPTRNNTNFLPASTYKILNSLIALETGVIDSDLDILTWDGIKRDLDRWNQDLNLRLAFKYSAVWFYQILSRKIGYQRMQYFVNQTEYGNQNIGNPEDIDRFWLKGELRITPKQQIEFLYRLYRNNLPFSQRTIDIVKDIAIVEQTPDYVLRAKTGLASSVTPNIGWYVGYLEQNNNVYFFATNLKMSSENPLTTRLEITRLCLQDLGLF